MPRRPGPDWAPHRAAYMTFDYVAMLIERVSCYQGSPDSSMVLLDLSCKY